MSSDFHIIHSYLEGIDLSCEECGGLFKIEHDMGPNYIPQYCVFCRSEIYTEEMSDTEQRMLEEH